MKRRALLFPAILGTALVLAGCGGLSPEMEGLASAGSDEADQGEKITLTLADSWTTTSTTAMDVVHRKLVERFRQENPQIAIDEDILDNASLKTKIKTLAAGNVLPDVFMLFGSDARMFLENKLIRPVDDVLTSDPEWRRGFRPEAFEDFRVGGQLAGIPLQMTATSIVYYNEEILKRAGFPAFPSTWEDFLHALEKIKAMGMTPIAMGNKDQWVGVSCLLSTLGDRFTGTDWFRSIELNSGASFADSTFVGALTAVRRLSELGAFGADLNSLDNVQQRTAYYVGKAAMFIEGGWAVSSVISDAPKPILDRTHLAILPAVPGGRGEANTVSGGSGWALALNAGLHGAKLEAAVKFVKLLTGRTEAELAAERGDISATLAADFDTSGAPALFREYLELLKRMKLTPVYDVRLSPEVVETMNSGLQELLTPGSKLTPAQLAQRIQDTYNPAVKQY